MGDVTAKSSGIKLAPNAIPPTIQEENSAEMSMDSPNQTGLMKQTNIAVCKFRQILVDHEAAIAQVKR